MARSLIPSLFGGTPARQSGDPFVSLQREVNRLFEDVFRGFGGSPAALGENVPRMNICETEQEYRLEAELPGVSENDIEVTLNDDVLTIRGEKKSEQSDKQENYHVTERTYGSFMRSVRLPFAVSPDDINASFQDGVLTVTLPKQAAQVTAQRIEINKNPMPAGQTGAGQSGSQTTH
jgi:HSP20 family protein